MTGGFDWMEKDRKLVERDRARANGFVKRDQAKADFVAAAPARGRAIEVPMLSRRIGGCLVPPSSLPDASEP